MLFVALARLFPHVSFDRTAQQLILLSQVVLVFIPSLLFYPAYGTLVPMARQVFPSTDLSFAIRIGLDVIVIILLKIILERIIHYRIAPMFILRLGFCQEEIRHDTLTVTPGRPIVEILMGEVYDYLRFWRKKPTPRTLTVLLYLETYKGLLELQNKIRSGAWLLPDSTVLMVFTPLLNQRTADRLHAAMSPEVVKPHQMAGDKMVYYRVMMFFATRMNSFAGDFPLPSFYRRGYFPAGSLVSRDAEDFLKAEIARLSIVADRMIRSTTSR
jgi:hypothetical protein